MQTALRASRVVRKQLSADPFEYHAKSSGFWDKVRKAVVVNPCVLLACVGRPRRDERRSPSSSSSSLTRSPTLQQLVDR